LNALLGDWFEIIRKPSCGLPLTLGEVLRHQAAAPSAVEMCIDVAKIDAQFRLAVPSVLRDFLNEITQVLIGIAKIAE
jgi:hypothetical protein